MKISEKEITEKDKFAAIAISATLIQKENPKTAEELRENLREHGLTFEVDTGSYHV